VRGESDADRIASSHFGTVARATEGTRSPPAPTGVRPLAFWTAPLATIPSRVPPVGCTYGYRCVGRRRLFASSPVRATTFSRAFCATLWAPTESGGQASRTASPSIRSVLSAWGRRMLYESSPVRVATWGVLFGRCTFLFLLQSEGEREGERSTCPNLHFAEVWPPALCSWALLRLFLFGISRIEVSMPGRKYLRPSYTHTTPNPLFRFGARGVVRARLCIKRRPGTRSEKNLHRGENISRRNSLSFAVGKKRSRWFDKREREREREREKRVCGLFFGSGWFFFFPFGLLVFLGCSSFVLFGITLGPFPHRI